MHRLLEVRILANDECVFATKLHDHGRDALRAPLDDATPILHRADEQDRVDVGAYQGSAGGAIALDCLDQVGIVTHVGEHAAEPVDELGARPRDPFRRFDHDGVARHQRGDDRVDDVLVWVVPRNDRGHDADGVVLEARLLVEQQAGRDGLWAEVLLAVLDHPSELLAGRPDLSDQRVLARLAGVALDRFRDLVLVVDGVRHEPAEHGSALLEGALPPFLLRCSGAGDGRIDVARGIDTDLAE